VRRALPGGESDSIWPSPMQNDEQAIRELIATWLSASKAGDTEKVLSLMADDVVFLVPGQPPMRGKAQEIKVLGDWAYLWTKLTVVVTPKNGGPSVLRAGHTLSILQKQSGRWLLFRDANMLAVVQQ
jgi:ketosteroid isomerase-like protein